MRVGKSALIMLRRDGEGSTEPKYMIPRCQEKRLEREVVPVPQTDTGRGGENHKAGGRITVKELGKLTP